MLLTLKGFKDICYAESWTGPGRPRGVGWQTDPRARKDDWSRWACCLWGLKPSWGLHEPRFPRLSQSSGLRTLLGILQKTHTQIEVGAGLIVRTHPSDSRTTSEPHLCHPEMRSWIYNSDTPNQKLGVTSPHLNFIHFIQSCIKKRNLSIWAFVNLMNNKSSLELKKAV